MTEKCVSVSLEELLLLENRALRLKASKSLHKMAGLHQARLHGRGLEFAGSRPYQSGDDVRSIDWRVTARTGKPHTKLFALEKERQVLLLVDMRAAMFFATEGVFKSVQAATIAGYIAWNASLTGNRVGGMVFNEAGHIELRPRLGKKGLLPLLQALASKGAFPPPKGAAFSIDQAIANLASVAAPGSLICLISDFRKVSSLEPINQLSRHAEVLLCLVYDPFEVELPKNGPLPIAHGKEHLQLNTCDVANLQRYKLQFQTRWQSLQSADARVMQCSTAEDSFFCLQQHFYT